MLVQSNMSPVTQPVFPAHREGERSSALIKLTTHIHDYIEQHHAGLSVDDGAEFIRQCQQVFYMLIESISNQTPMYYQAQNQLVQGFYDRLLREWDPHLNEVIANPQLVHSCILFVAVKFNHVHELTPEHLCDLAEHYANGNDLVKDEVKAAELYRLAADHASARAQLGLGLCYQLGKGVGKDDVQAATFFKQAADQGNVIAMNHLGLCCQQGTGVAKNEAEAVRLFQQAAEQGVVAAIVNLALCYLHGTGVDKDAVKAGLHFQRAVHLGSPEAMLNLGLCYKHGLGMARDPMRAAALFKQAANLGNVAAIVNLGLCCKYGSGITTDHFRAFALFNLASEQGDANGSNNLGLCYRYGTGVAKDEAKAFTLFQQAIQQAIQQGNVAAINNLGQCYRDGVGVAKNEVEAIRLFHQASEKSSPAARLNLGLCYQHGTGVPKDDAMAATWFQRAAKLGDATALNQLGRCHQDGRGVDKDDAKAVTQFEQAVDMGNSVAMVNLGLCYLHGNGVASDAVKAVQLFQRAAAQDNAAAICQLGRCYEFGTGAIKNEARAAALYQQAAALGSTNAIFNLAMCYEYGKGVPKDEMKAVILFEKAANQGLARAIVNLGFCCDLGRGVTKDEARAAELYLQASELGNMTARTNLGVCYEYGKGVPKDNVKAAKLYQEATDQGHAAAINNLGRCYEDGIGVDKDEEIAAAHYRQAAHQHNATGYANLAMCYELGKGVDKNEEKAFAYYELAADRGNLTALNNLGLCYKNGIGVAKNEAQATKYFMQAAEKEEANALNNLGLCYEYGTGVLQDEAMAAKLYLQAADLGNIAALNNLGVCYLYGKGVPKNEDQAALQYQEAAHRGHVQANFNLGVCYLHGTGVQQNDSRAAYYFLQAYQAGYLQAGLALNILYALDVVSLELMEQADAVAHKQKIATFDQLHQAITDDNLEAIKRWGHADNINQRYGTDQLTPLMYVLKEKKWMAARELLRLGADVSLTDRKYGTVFDNMDPDFAIELLAQRPRVSRQRIEQIIQDCLAGYQPDNQHVSENLIVLNHAVGLLIGVGNCAQLLFKNKEIYLAHLNSRKLYPSQIFEGMMPSDVWALKIFDNLRLIMLLHHGQLDMKNSDTQQLRSQLTGEIVVATELTKWEELSNYSSYLDPGKVSVEKIVAINQAVVANFIVHLGELADGNEMLYRTGYLSGSEDNDLKQFIPDSGHCIYVAFHRRGDELVVRVDNLWEGDIAGKHRRSGNQTHRVPHQDKYYPYLVRVLPMQGLDNLKPYVLSLLNIRKLTYEKVLPQIYLPHSQSQIGRYNFPDCGPQRIGNCTAKNYYVGELYRLGRPLLHQLRVKEKGLVTDIQKNTLPKMVEQNQRAQKLPLRGGPELPPVPLPSHEQLLKKMAACLQVHEREVREGCVVEQTLVGLAGITASQARALFRRDENGNTSFILALTESESIAFHAYYSEHYPELILQSIQQSDTEVRVVVSTHCLLDQVVPAMGKQRSNHGVQS